MKNTHTVVITGIFLFSSALFAQNATLQGKGLDKAGKPLDHITVKVDNKLTGFTRLAVSGEDGELMIFAIPPADHYNISLIKNGKVLVKCENIEFNVEENKIVDMDLKETVVEKKKTRWP